LLHGVEPMFWRNDPTILETMLKFCLWQNSVSLTLFGYFGIKYEQFDSFHTCFWESRTIPGTLLDTAIILTTLFLSAFSVIPVYGLISLSAEHNELMQKRKSKKMKAHGHGHGGGHGDDHGGDSGHSGGGHGGGHGDDHGGDSGHSGGGHGEKKEEHEKVDKNWGR
jgi:hypothetical protein